VHGGFLQWRRTLGDRYREYLTEEPGRPFRKLSKSPVSKEF
jgi:hypothetical protein